MQNTKGSGRPDGIAPVRAPTPPDVRFSASGGCNRSVSSSQSSELPRRSLSRLDGLHPWAFFVPGRTTAVVTSPRFDRSHRGRLDLGCAGWLLWPFAPPAFGVSAGIFTTTASADSSGALTPEVSPGKVLNFPCAPTGSTWCVWMNFGLRVCSHARRPHPASLPDQTPLVAGLPAVSFGSTLAGVALQFGYGCSHQLRCCRFMFISSGPCRAHEPGSLNPVGARRRMACRGYSRPRERAAPNPGSLSPATASLGTDDP